MATFGYARVSTRDQDLAGQIAELQAAGCGNIFKEKVSGAKTDRPELAKVIRRLESGDVLVVTRVPTANLKPLTATANRPILAPDERSLQVDLVRLDRTGQVAGCVGSRDPGPSTPTQRAAAQIPEAIGVRQY